jgi:hypothetical protein
MTRRQVLCVATTWSATNYGGIEIDTDKDAITSIRELRSRQ